MASHDNDEPAGHPGEFSLESIPLHSTDLLTVLDRDGVIQYESPAIERVLGFSQDELVGEQVADYFHPDDRERALSAFETVVESDSDTYESVEFRHRTADGTYQWVESASSSNAAPGDSYIVSSRDISERKRRERELERKNERLDRFASVVSHDLRNPLNVATLRLAMARETCDSDHLDDVARAHDRMERLIEEVLALTRSETGAEETLDLATVAEHCWQHVSTAGATLVTETAQSVRADRSRLEQLFENLFRNAVEEGGGDGVDGTAASDTVVTVGELDGRDGFYVADDGPGIAADRRESVFDSGNTTKQDGTGLGLAIVEMIVEAHGWEVGVGESEAGGARFEISGVAFV
jgi:PAS domain S-box-containing protein